MKTTCPNCAHRLKFADEQTGKKVRCPKCQQPFRLPASHLPESTGGMAMNSDEARDATPAPGLNTLGESARRGVARVHDEENSQAAKCCQCGGSATQKRACEVWIHGYNGRTKLSTKFGLELPGTITATKEYTYEGFCQESGWLCEQCVGKAEKRIFTVYALIFGSFWLVLLSMSVYGIVVENYAWLIGCGIFFLFSLLVAFLAGHDAMAKAPENLFFKIRRPRLKKRGLRVIGPGREPTT
jgi:predicted Zn finger-like uncharacterized protein